MIFIKFICSIIDARNQGGISMKKKIRIYSSLIALTFLSTSILCACTNTDTSTAAKTDQSRFYFHAAEKAADNKRTNFYIDSDNNLWAWDSVYPDYPYIGNAFLPPTEPEPIMKNIKEVVPTGMYNDLFYVLDTDNSLWELPTDMNPSIPKKKLLDDVTVPNMEHAITANGDLYVWGDQTRYISGMVGLTKEEMKTPRCIVKQAVHTDIDTSTSFAIDQDGYLWSWGECQYGQLGQGEAYIRSSSPTIIADHVAKFYRSRDRGEPTMYALKTDGTLWAWGYNQYGAVGNGTTETVSIPTKVLDHVKTFTCTACPSNGAFDTYTNAFALREDDSLWAWGYNGEGNLGNGTTESALSPVKILDDVAEIETDINMYTNLSFAIKKDGSLWGWGYNRYGQLCTGNTEPVLLPVKITDNVKDYCPLYASLYFVKQDNTLWGSGFNISSFSNDQPELTSPVLLQENVDHIQTIDDTVFSFGTNGSLSICGYNDVVEINDSFDSPYEIDRRKILDNVAWIDGVCGDIFAMTNDGKLMNFSVVTVYDGKVQPTKPVEIPLPLT